MGKLALAAKITHVPSMYLSELDGPHKGCRQAAIDGHREIGRRCRELGVDTIVVFDTHWLVGGLWAVVVPNLLNAVVGIVAGGLVVAVVTVVARLRKGQIVRLLDSVWISPFGSA